MTLVSWLVVVAWMWWVSRCLSNVKKHLRSVDKSIEEIAKEKRAENLRRAFDRTSP